MLFWAVGWGVEICSAAPASAEGAPGLVLQLLRVPDPGTRRSCSMNGGWSWGPAGAAVWMVAGVRRAPVADHLANSRGHGEGRAASNMKRHPPAKGGCRRRSWVVPGSCIAGGNSAVVALDGDLAGRRLEGHAHDAGGAARGNPLHRDVVQRCLNRFAEPFGDALGAAGNGEPGQPHGRGACL